jgi:hypothetical protein
LGCLSFVCFTGSLNSSKMKSNRLFVYPFNKIAQNSTNELTCFLFLLLSH